LFCREPFSPSTYRKEPYGTLEVLVQDRRVLFLIVTGFALYFFPANYQRGLRQNAFPEKEDPVIFVTQTRQGIFTVNWS
jgi:hypothetical protein